MVSVPSKVFRQLSLAFRAGLMYLLLTLRFDPHLQIGSREGISHVEKGHYETLCCFQSVQAGPSHPLSR